MSSGMAVSDRMREFIARLAATGVAAPCQLRGCTPEEVRRLEWHYGVRLPESYGLFLQHMGHGAGRLGNSGEFDLYYPAVLRLTREERQFRSEVRAENPTAALADLPPQALVICGRHGEQFSFIECTRPDDSPVFYFNRWEQQVRQTHDSYFGFLEAMWADAEHWMVNGGGEHYPGWTQ